jgi:hypothetical protein
MRPQIGGTPFDRPATANPLLTIAVSMDELDDRDADMAERVLALAEFPFLSVIRTYKKQPVPVHDLLVRSVPSSDPVGPSGSVSPATAIEFVRLLLTNLGMFFVRRNFEVNEGFYYLYRYKSSFPTYQKAWSTAICGQTAISSDVRDQLQSLGTRLDFLCRSFDRGAHNSLRRANNDTEDNTLYHLAYFVMLVTGMLDDLAWILAYLFSLKLRRIDVKLRIDAGRDSSPFLDAIRVASPNVADKLADTEIQKLIRAFYPIRDRLQHRQFLLGVLHVGRPWTEPRILFDFSEAIQPLLLASSDGTGRDWGVQGSSPTYVDPYVFLSRGFKAAGSIHEEVLGAINWVTLLGPKGNTERDCADKSLERWHVSPAAFFKWPAAPLYF